MIPFTRELLGWSFWFEEWHEWMDRKCSSLKDSCQLGRYSLFEIRILIAWICDADGNGSHLKYYSRSVTQSESLARERTKAVKLSVCAHILTHTHTPTGRTMKFLMSFWFFLIEFYWVGTEMNSILYVLVRRQRSISWHSLDSVSWYHISSKQSRMEQEK